MSKSRQQSNQRAKWGTPAKRRSTAKGNGVRTPVPGRVINRQVTRDAHMLVAHMRNLYQKTHPHLTMIQINLLIAHQLGLIKKK